MAHDMASEHMFRGKSFCGTKCKETYKGYLAQSAYNHEIFLIGSFIKVAYVSYMIE